MRRRRDRLAPGRGFGPPESRGSHSVSVAGDTPEARMVGQGRAKAPALGPPGVSRPPEGRAGSRRWRYGETCPRRQLLDPVRLVPEHAGPARSSCQGTGPPRKEPCPVPKDKPRPADPLAAEPEPRSAEPAPPVAEEPGPRLAEPAPRPAEPRPRLATVGEAAAAHSQLEAALFEIKRVIVGQEGMLERVFIAL